MQNIKTQNDTKHNFTIKNDEHIMAEGIILNEITKPESCNDDDDSHSSGMYDENVYKHDTVQRWTVTNLAANDFSTLSNLAAVCSQQDSCMQSTFDFGLDKAIQLETNDTEGNVHFSDHENSEAEGEGHEQGTATVE